MSWKPWKSPFIVRKEQIYIPQRLLLKSDARRIRWFIWFFTQVTKTKYIFATQPDLRPTFTNLTQEEFDYILVDEVHPLGWISSSFDYFKPKFLLGLTATPERTDGYELFDYNIAYKEIRLQDALEADLYYYITLGWPTSKKRRRIDFWNHPIKELIPERTGWLCHGQKLTYYGLDKGKVKGLVFCSTAEKCDLSRL